MRVNPASFVEQKSRIESCGCSDTVAGQLALLTMEIGGIGSYCRSQPARGKEDEGERVHR